MRLMFLNGTAMSAQLHQGCAYQAFLRADDRLREVLDRAAIAPRSTP